MAETPKGRSSRARGASTPKKKRRTRGQKVGRFFGVLAIVVAVGLVAGVGALAIGYSRTTIPDPNKDFTTNTTFVYYNDGKTQLSTLAVQNRQSISYAKMPGSIEQAVVAAENRTFWTDPGISVPGMARAALNILKGGSLQGGSTITQQYIKIFYLNEDQTVTRKINEVFLAAKLGRTVPKEVILGDYLNTIYFGHGAYGIQAAAKAYFNEDAGKLSVSQAAVLASVINNPSLFDPSDDANLPRLRDRYRYVLAGMQAAGNITAAQETQDAKALPKFPEVKTSERYGGSKGFLLKAVESELGTLGMDQAQVNGGGYKIITTFDKSSQDAAVQAAQRYIKKAAGNAHKKTSTLHAAVASVDVNSGAVLAMYGGPDYITNSRNWATTPRPTASTFKAFTLAAGLDDGYSLRSTFHGNTWYLPNDKIPVRNENNDQYGYGVNLVRATTLSINTAFVDLITKMKDGKAKVEKLAEEAGAPKNTGWDAAERNIPIGTPEVSPLNMASAYATFANGGTHVPRHVIAKILDHSGKVIYTADPKSNRVVSKDIASDVTYALSNVVEQGTGRSVQTLDRPVAGKTGTNGVDIPGKGNVVNSSWFVGYTKQISTAVMYVAGDSGSQSLDPYRQPGNTTFYGATYPALTWVDYMKTATKGQDVEKFPDAAYVNADQPAGNQNPFPQDPQTASQSQPTTGQSQPTTSQTQNDQPTPSSGSSTSADPGSASAPATSQAPSDAPSAPTQAPSQAPSQPATTAPASSQPTRTSRPSSQPTQTSRPSSQPTRTSQPSSKPTKAATKAATSRAGSGPASAGSGQSRAANGSANDREANSGQGSGGG